MAHQDPAYNGLPGSGNRSSSSSAGVALGSSSTSGSDGIPSFQCVGIQCSGTMGSEAGDGLGFLRSHGWRYRPV